MYKKIIKRFLDLVLSCLAIIFLSWLFILLIIVGCFAMRGNPFFIQIRPGKMKNGNERLFKLVKFRTMANLFDKEGNFLPDAKRITNYGKFLRSTSLDELPELFNVLIGNMSLIGPRPQLVKDMVFMSESQRKRHEVLPGLTGLAQVSGRNNISWEQKFTYDLQYVNNISFLGDLKILLETVVKVLKREDTVREGTVSDMDYGDWLLEQKKITQNEYNDKLFLAKIIVSGAKH